MLLTVVAVLNQKPIILGKKQTRRFTCAPGNGFITYFICMFPLGANNGEKNREKKNKIKETKKKKAYKICKGETTTIAREIYV